MSNALSLTVPPPLSFAGLSARMLEIYSPPLRARATWYGMRTALREFESRVKPTSASDLNTLNVARYIAARGETNVNTTISRLRCLKTVSRYAAAEGWIDRPPQWSRLALRATPPIRRRHLDHDQVAKLLDHLRGQATTWTGKRLHALTATIAYTGLRSREATGLQLADVNLADGLLRVVARRRLKTASSAAPVPIPPELAEVLAAWIPEAGPVWLFPGVRRRGPWEGGSPGYRSIDRLKAEAKAAGIDGDVTWHAFRHTLAKLFVGLFGGTAEQARSLLRHADVRTTEEHYLHRDDLEILRAIGRRISFRALS